MKRLLPCAVLLSLAVSAISGVAQTASKAVVPQPAAIPLWPKPNPNSTSSPALALAQAQAFGVPGAKGTEPEDTPSLQPYLAPAEKANGAAIIVCPGGDYAALTPREGADVARWLNSIGVSAFVLQYRLAPRYQHPAMLWDVQRALRTVRAYARRWQLDPQRIGVLGFAAGGHLAATAATHFDEGQVGFDGTEWYSSRPDVAILCYPLITLTQPYTHAGTRQNLLGANPSTELIQLLSNEKQVTAQTPPTFLFHTKDDVVVPVENSLLFAEALRRYQVPHELQLFEHGPHGVGLAQDDPVLRQWPKRLEQWLRGRGFLTPSAKPPNYRPSALVALINALRATPPEFAASKLIHIATLHAGSDVDWKRELLLEAFQFAERAQHPVKLKALGGPAAQPPDAALQSFELKLDRVSLQTSVVMELLKFDQPKALELVRTMARLQIPAGRCEDSAWPDVEAFYTMLMYVATDCFTPAQKQRNLDLAFLEPFIQAIEHPSQVGPAARIVNSVGVMMAQRARLVQAFARALANVGYDDRAFAAEQDTAIQAVLNLSYQASSRELPTGELMDQLRDYLVRQLNAPRCADNVALANGKPVMPRVVEQFNLALSLSPHKPSPISEEELRPTLQEGRLAVRSVEPSPQYKRVQEKLFALMKQTRPGAEALAVVGAGQQTEMRLAGAALSAVLSAETKQQLDELLAELEQWKPEHEVSAEAYFQRRCQVYNGLLSALPLNESSQRLLSEFLDFLSGSPLRNQNFMAWYWPVNTLFQTRRMYVDGTQWPHAGVMHASDPVLQISARLEAAIIRATPP